MRKLIRAAIVLLGVVTAAQVLGCARPSDSSVSSKDSDPLRGDRIGYYEVSHEGDIYVVGSIQSRDKVRSGQVPTTTSRGLNLQGQAVLFETDNAGLSDRLKAEYSRRHGLSGVAR
jgi:hypothetical protein